VIGKTISHYKILEKLGEGGMGVVYKAEDTKLDRQVALKFLPPELTRDLDAKTRFIHEAKAAAALSHPNICTVYEIEESEGQTFIATECIEGETLKEKIASGPMKIDEALSTVIQIAEGLQEAHEKGIVHRDIKSANIMVTPKGQAKIMDFGLAKLAGGTKLTKTGTTVGTIAYMSPEQARAEEVDHRSDVWSLGVVLYEMFTGQLPFKGDYNEAVIYSILNEAPEPVTALRTGVPMELERAVLKALEKEAGRRYQSAKELLVDLRNVRDRESSKVSVGKPSIKPSTTPSRIPWRKILIPAVIISVIAIALIVGLRIQVGRQPSAVAAENSLAVMYFDNLADPEDKEKLGEIATSLLITDLSESHYVKVLSSQRLYDILKLLGREGQKRIDRDVATQVAEKAGARWMLLGSILQITPHIEITTQLVEVASGNVEASQRISGEPGDEIFSLVDKLTVEVKADLALPAAAEREPDPTIADVTTDSPEAYRYYLEGNEYQNKFYHNEAEASYRKALEFDSTFAMLNFYLWNNVSGKEAEEFLARAVRYSKKATRKERAYISYAQASNSGDDDKAIEELEKIVAEYPEEKLAFAWLGNWYRSDGRSEEAIRSYRRAVEIDPLYMPAWNWLTYAYNDIGDIDKSIWAVNHYISIAPDEANPFDVRGDLYAWSGQLNEAIASYEKALERKPDFSYSTRKLGHMHLFKRQYGKAEEYYRRFLSEKAPNRRAEARLNLALIPIYQGKFEEALRVLDAGISADLMDRYEGYYGNYKHVLKAEIYGEQGELDLALREAQIAAERYREKFPDALMGYDGLVAYCLTQAGRVSEAEKIMTSIGEKRNIMNNSQLSYYMETLGMIEYVKGESEASIEFLREKIRLNPSSNHFVDHYFLGRAYLETGRLGEAVAALERAVSKYDEEWLFDTGKAVKVHYFLGMAYERSDWTDKAIEQYEEFLDIWKNADPGMEEIEDARARLARLKSAA
jgi:serine/threonine protein kinase/cytochrome c-type biogenesis protein CcmH/NrfG